MNLRGMIRIIQNPEKNAIHQLCEECGENYLNTLRHKEDPTDAVLMVKTCHTCVTEGKKDVSEYYNRDGNQIK